MKIDDGIDGPDLSEDIMKIKPDTKAVLWMQAEVHRA
jgi:hypothetical protein